MKVIVCGAGQVGYNIARELAAEDIGVTVIDKRRDLIGNIGDNLEVTTIVGRASEPDVLELAGARDADMIIAVTQADEVNMVACQVAHSLFRVPTRIARVRARSYLSPLWSDLFRRDHMPIDFIISPEREVALAIARRLEVPGAFDVIPLAGQRLRLIGVRCTDTCPVVNTPLRQLSTLFPDLGIVVVGIRRDDRPVIPRSEDRMQSGDDVYFVVDADQVTRAMEAFGHEKSEVRRLVIVGGGNIGLQLAEAVETDAEHARVRLIEIDKERAELAARSCGRTIVLQGDALDPEILDEAGVSRADTVVAVTNDDEVNILASLLAKRAGARRAVTLVAKAIYPPLMRPLGVDVVVDPRAITVSTILQHVRRGRIHSVHSIGADFGEIIEAEAMETSGLVNVPLREAKLPAGVVIAAVVRDDSVEMARGDTAVRAGDRVVLFASKKAIRKVEQLFSVRLEFF